MIKRKITILLLCALLIFVLVACGGGSSVLAVPIDEEATTSQSNETVPVSTGINSVAEATAENSQNHEDAQDYTVESSEAVSIVLNGNSIAVTGDGATVNGRKVTITSAGIYTVDGSLTDGQIVVDTADSETVKLILNGVTINNSTTAPIYVANAEEVVLMLADGSENVVSDGAAYVFPNAETDEPNAAIFAKSDLTIYGTGQLTVTGNYNDGIASKDGLIIASGTLTVAAADDGIRGKDYLVVKDGDITVNAQGDGLKSDNEEDATKGYIAIETGNFTITAGGDAITAQTDVLITDGEFILTAGGGSNGRIDETTSAKGIKAGVNVNIDGGNFTLNTADDAIHSNTSLVVNAGTFFITTGDDGIHADSTLTINGGDIQIAQSYEGIESAVITLNNGNIHLVSSDDGLNVAAGNDGSGTNQGPGGGPRQDNFTYTGDYWLYINGGTIVVEAAGDGVDVNGAIEMTDGVLIVHGPTQNMNGALDYDGTFNMTGGFLVAAGSVGMAQAPGQSSGQYAALINLNAAQQAGTLVHIQTSDGEEVLTFSPNKSYQSISFSSPELLNGETYEIYLGGSSTGTATNGLYEGGVYSGGTAYSNFTISSMVTQVGGNFR